MAYSESDIERVIELIKIHGSFIKAMEILKYEKQQKGGNYERKQSKLL